MPGVVFHGEHLKVLDVYGIGEDKCQHANILLCSCNESVHNTHTKTQEKEGKLFIAKDFDCTYYKCRKVFKSFHNI